MVAAFGIALGVAGLGRPGLAHAQERLSIEGRGGIAVPAGDLADLEDVGPSFGVGFVYKLNSRLALRLDGDVDILSGVDADNFGPEAPDLNIYHYTAGLDVNLLSSETSPWSLHANVGAGASTFDFDEFGVLGSTVDFTETYFTTNGGLKLAYSVADNVDVFAGVQAYLMFADEDDTAVFSALRSDIDSEGFDNVVTIPITVGFRIGL